MSERATVPIPTQVIDRLEHTYRSISTLCASFDEAQWKTATDLPGWSVQDNLSHLIGTERLLQGLPELDHRAADLTNAKNPIGEMNEHHVDLRRSRPGVEVLAEWDELVELRIATLRAGDEDYFAQPAVTPTGPGTMADFLQLRLLDCWSHEQDMRRAVGRAGDLDSPSAQHTIDRLMLTLPIVVGKRAGTPEGAAVAIELTGPVQRRGTYEVRGGRATLVDRPTAPPVATVRLDSDAFTTLALGRRPASEFTDRVELLGDRALGERIVSQLTMMI